jgi:hypothetical protein
MLIFEKYHQISNQCLGPTPDPQYIWRDSLRRYLLSPSRILNFSIVQNQHDHKRQILHFVHQMDNSYTHWLRRLRHQRNAISNHLVYFLPPRFALLRGYFFSLISNFLSITTYGSPPKSLIPPAQETKKQPDATQAAPAKAVSVPLSRASALTASPSGTPQQPQPVLALLAPSSCRLRCPDRPA